MYIHDLKVNQVYRRQGVGQALIRAGQAIAKGEGHPGLTTIAQDNNVGACLFYLEMGFVIGSLDTHLYRGSRQEGKVDIFFYLDLDQV